MDLQDVLYEQDSHFVTITLNRPDRLNALGGSLDADLNEALRAAEGDTDVRVVILTGAGRAFSAGLDLKERAAGKERRPHYLFGPPTPTLMHRMNKPVIGAVNGYAIGWGFELALLCDYRIGSEAAIMGDAHNKLGVVQANGGAFTLPRIVGWANACEILMTGENFNAHRLLELGVLNKVVPAEELLPAAKAFAQRIAVNAPLAVQMTKQLMRMAQHSEFDDVNDYAMLTMGTMLKSEDGIEGFAAQAEKRAPQFKGR